MRHTQQERLLARLRQIEAAIAQHPFSSARVRTANRIIEECEFEDRDTVSAALASHYLPTIKELDEGIVRHSATWWNLHRRHLKVTRRLEQFDVHV